MPKVQFSCFLFVCSYLKGNPFHCGCNLERLRLQLERNSLPVIQDVESIHCKTPLHLRNQALKSLSDLCGELHVVFR